MRRSVVHAITKPVASETLWTRSISWYSETITGVCSLSAATRFRQNRSNRTDKGRTQSIAAMGLGKFHEKERVVTWNDNTIRSMTKPEAPGTPEKNNRDCPTKQIAIHKTMNQHDRIVKMNLLF